MKVHSNASIQMSIGHGAKVTQITYLTAACRRAHRDDQNGYLDHPTRSPDGKVTPPGRSPTWPCQAGRLAWTWLASLAPPPKPNQYHCFADSQMDHQTLGYMPKVKLRPKGLIYIPLMGSRSGHSKVGLIIQGWTCTYMQRNTKRINDNHWMKLKTSGGMDGLV